MNKNIYILLLILIVEIYSTDPGKCMNNEDPTVQVDCDTCTNVGTEAQTEKATPAGEGKKAQCYTPRAHCQTYHETNDECAECDNGYTGYPAGSGPYTACKTTRAHCKTYDATNDECAECESSNYKLDGNPKACDTCNTGYTRVPSSGNPFKCYTTVTNCDGTFTNEGYNPNYDACYKCQDNYVFDANHLCKGGKSDCLEYNADYSQCTKCESYCKLLSGGSCDPVSNCVTVDQTNGNCVKCINGYKPKADGTCEQCLSNSVALDSDGVTCSTIRKDNNCVKFGSNGLCEQCKSSYLIETTGSGETAYTTCIQESSCSNPKEKVGLNCLPASTVTPTTPIENCEYYSGTAAAPICEKCDDYMYFDGSACKPCYHPQLSLNGKYCYTRSKITGCNIFDYTQDKCTTCNDKYTLQSDGSCEYQTCTTTICTNDNKEAKTSTENASNMKLNVLFVVLLLSIFW